MIMRNNQVQRGQLIVIVGMSKSNAWMHYCNKMCELVIFVFVSIPNIDCTNCQSIKHLITTVRQYAPW